MFIKIIKHDLEGKSRWTASTYQCSMVLVKSEDSENMTLVLEGISGRDDPLSIEVNKTHDREVYFMNDEGKTIDRYTWYEKRIIQEQEAKQ